MNRALSHLKKAASALVLSFLLTIPCMAAQETVSVRIENQTVIYSKDGSNELCLELALTEPVSADSYEFSIAYDSSIFCLRTDKLEGAVSDIELKVVDGGTRIVGISSGSSDVQIGSLGTLYFDILKKGTGTFKIAESNSWINRLATADITKLTSSKCTVKAACKKPGDINNDSAVDLLDIVRLVKYFAKPGVVVADSSVDTNADGLEDSADIIRLARYLSNPANVVIY